MGRVLSQHTRNPGFWSSVLHKLGMVAHANNSNRWAQETTKQDQDRPGLYKSLSQTIPAIHTPPTTHTPKKETCKFKLNPAMTSGNCEQPPERATWKRSELLCRLRDKSSLSAMCLSPLLSGQHTACCQTAKPWTTLLYFERFILILFICVSTITYLYMYVRTHRGQKRVFGTLELEFLAVMSHLTSINSGPCKNTKHS